MILKPLTEKELENIFDETGLRVLEICMRKCLFAQPERLLGQPILPIQVPKEHIEQWVVQAIGGMPVGAGSYPVDIIKECENEIKIQPFRTSVNKCSSKFGADIKMLSCKVNLNGELSDTTSGETSLAQKFTSAGVDLDISFKNREYDKIVSEWSMILGEKLQKVEKEHGVDDIYYIFILRAQDKFHLCATKVDTSKIEEMTANHDKTTDNSVYVDNLIDENFGNAKIYKAKKRLELRLKPKWWVDNGYVKTFDFSWYTAPTVNLRKVVEEDKEKEYFEGFISGFVNE